MPDRPDLTRTLFNSCEFMYYPVTIGNAQMRRETANVIANHSKRMAFDDRSQARALSSEPTRWTRATFDRVKCAEARPAEFEALTKFSCVKSFCSWKPDRFSSRLNFQRESNLSRRNSWDIWPISDDRRGLKDTIVLSGAQSVVRRIGSLR